MRFCHACREPAVRSGASGHGAERAILRYYCYVHAREAGLLEGRLASLLSTGAATGTSTTPATRVGGGLGGLGGGFGGGGFVRPGG